MSNQKAEKAVKQPLSNNDISRFLRKPDYQRSKEEAVIHAKAKNGGLPKDESLESNFEHNSVPVRLERTAKTIAKIPAITRESNPATKRFWVLITDMGTAILFRPGAYAITSSCPLPLQRLLALEAH
ncbi:hypothetical protein BELL_0112g00190 [Botrytis elliptica]|uniref:Uncharacterized protein n=1 Tax=Botrytis elliptica TaxID=278938 RepID=A0A4Z1JU19_9HELO|nr:hypothetical protein BELL_0112g00190 [Botrytis elliptica]